MLEPPRSSAEAPYTPCSLCGGVFPVGSMRFEVLQQPRTFALHTYLVQKHPTHSKRFAVLEPPRASA